MEATRCHSGLEVQIHAGVQGQETLGLDLTSAAAETETYRVSISRLAAVTSEDCRTTES